MIPCWEPLFARFLAGSGRHVRSRPHQQFPKTAVNVKLLLPPRQSRGVSYRTLGATRQPVSSRFRLGKDLAATAEMPELTG